MNPVVETTGGKVEGWEKDGINTFLGIPFTAPPVGKRRWLSPEPVEPWAGVKETKSFVAMAPQMLAAPSQDSPLQVSSNAETRPGRQPDVNEDCLHLNIWTPGTDAARRPVMVWIHGGGFTGGTGASPLSDFGVLARRGDVVVVTINYRLNIFGFLRLKDVTDNRIPSTGNEGMLDQVSALKWVRDNIGAFGGDPGNVTVFGLSAGGGSVCALLGMPAARGLFHKAISQSGSAHFLVEKDEANRYAEHFLNVLGVDGSDATALHELTMKQVFETYIRSLPVPRGIRSPMVVVDGEVFREMPIDSIKAGSADGIPLVAGTTADEWRLWQAMDPAIKDLTEGHMVARFSRMMPDWDMLDVLGAYREILAQRGVDPTPSEVYLAIMTARMFWIPTTRLLEAQARRGSAAYGYRFTWKAPFKGGLFGAFHGMDSGFLWGNYQPEVVGSGPAADTLSRNMQDAWIAFARTGAPGGKGLGRWPVYGELRETMLLGEQCEVQEAPFEDERRLWDLAPDNVYKWQ